MTTHGIQFRQVTKRYGGANAPLIVKGIDFTVPKGTLTTILGPSGCGKTTTLRMIAGLESPSGGQILIDGRDVTSLGPSERNVSMVFQSYALFPHYNVYDNVAYGLKLRKVPKAEAQQRIERILSLVELSGMESRMTNQLSGGQQQRVALARALAPDPQLLLLDEPFSNLDGELRRKLSQEVREILKARGISAILVTHDQQEAFAVSDHVGVFNEGRLQQ